MITTSSVESTQIPLLIVHLNVTLVPMVNPVTVEDGDEGIVIVAGPATTLHNPVPTTGVFPDKEVDVTAHKF